MVEKDAVSKDFSKQVLGYGLTTAEIVYRRPDRHWLLQTYVWQDYDMFPNFPALKDFFRSGNRNSTAPCSPSPSRIPSWSSLPNCTPSTASFDCIDPDAAETFPEVAFRQFPAVPLPDLNEAHHGELSLARCSLRLGLDDGRPFFNWLTRRTFATEPGRQVVPSNGRKMHPIWPELRNRMVAPFRCPRTGP